MSEELTPEELAEYEASAAELIATAANPEIPAGRFVAVDCETLIEMIERKSDESDRGETREGRREH